MSIIEVAKHLNREAVNGRYKISALPELRKRYLQKIKLPSTIFTEKTIFNGAEQYAFHHGGRDEIQFNVGEEVIGGEKVTRVSLSFSLEPSQSLHHPVDELERFRRSFNYCLKIHPEFFRGFKMWYYRDGFRYGNYAVQEIPEDWFQINTFISLGVIIEKPLSQLNEADYSTILEDFDKLLPIYQFSVLENNLPVLPKKIFTRLTSNDNNWEFPSPHSWENNNQHNSGIPFENQYGFGHEEWLLNQRYNLNGYQYGFIRGIQDSREGIGHYNEVHLYTVRKENKKRAVYYVGVLKDVIVIKNIKKEQELISNIIDRFYPDMISEVERVNGAIDGIINFRYKPVVKFKMENAFFYDQPIYQPNFDLNRFKRFQPYALNGSITDIFETGHGQSKSIFIAGKAEQTTVFNRRNGESSVTVEKVHSEIIEALEIFLQPGYSVKANNISIEKTRFKGNIADVVTQEADASISIFEVKTSPFGRRSIREAIAQLLDYALHSDYKVNKLIIVAPAMLTKVDIEFLRELERRINFPLEYLCYLKNDEKKFISQ